MARKINFQFQYRENIQHSCNFADQLTISLLESEEEERNFKPCFLETRSYRNAGKRQKEFPLLDEFQTTYHTATCKLNI